MDVDGAVTEVIGKAAAGMELDGVVCHFPLFPEVLYQLAAILDAVGQNRVIAHGAAFVGEAVQPAVLVLIHGSGSKIARFAHLGSQYTVHG